MRKNLGVSLVVTLVLVLAVGVAGAAEKYKGFERGEALITAKELKQLIDAKDPKLVILAVAKTTDYRLGHVPGAFQDRRRAGKAASSPVRHAKDVEIRGGTAGPCGLQERCCQGNVADNELHAAGRQGPGVHRNP